MNRPTKFNKPGLPTVATHELIARSTPLPQREAVILVTLLNHPWLIADEAETLSELVFTEPGLAKLRDALLSAMNDENLLDRDRLYSHVTDLGLAPALALVERAITHRGDKFADPEADRAAVEKGWHHVVALHKREALRQDLLAAEQSWLTEGSEDAFARICELQQLLSREDGIESGFESIIG
jgi:DNA primase